MKKIAVFGFVLTWILLTGVLIADDLIREAEIIRNLTPKQTPSANRSFNKSTERGYGGIKDDSPSQTFRNIQFRFNSAELTPAATAQLQELGRALQNENLKNYVFRIEGHTCDLGGDAYNLKLSRKRALSVRNFLVSHFDLSEKHLEVEGFGPRQPVVPNTDEASREKNRRVVIKNTLSTSALPLNTTGHPKISIAVHGFTNHQKYEIENGDTLSQNDSYAVVFKPKTSMYVYIYQVDSTGKPMQLFPNSELSNTQNPAVAGHEYRIPESGKWLTLDNTVGKEEIIVLADKDALAEPQKICMQHVSGTNPMLASKSEEQSRGFGGVRPELNTSVESPSKTDAPIKPASPQKESESLFVWKRYFNHQ